jgi:hypothetical protein
VLLQCYCLASTCRAASKAASQARWLAKPENQDYFRGPVILTEFGERVLPVDAETARHMARLGELVHRQPVSLPVSLSLPPPSGTAWCC